MPRPATVRVPPELSHPRSHSSTTPVKTVSPSWAAVKLTASASTSASPGSHRQVSWKLSQGVPHPYWNFQRTTSGRMILRPSQQVSTPCITPHAPSLPPQSDWGS